MYHIDSVTPTVCALMGIETPKGSSAKPIREILEATNGEKVEKILPILKQPVRSFVAVGSVIMAALGLSFASETSVFDAAKIALYAAALTASLPPVAQPTCILIFAWCVRGCNSRSIISPC